MTTINPAATVAASGSEKSSSAWRDLSGSFETFVQLLTTQLQFQDPLKPMETEKFTEQLVAYSQVEQQIASNDKLDNLVELAEGEGLGSALSYLGWQVSSKNRELSLFEGQASFSVKTSDKVDSVTVGIYDSNGKVVRGITIEGEKFTPNQKQMLYWDGTDNNGNQLADGAYKISVVAKDADGKTIPSSSTTYGLVTGVGYDDNGNTVLRLGDVELKPSDVLDVSSYTRQATAAPGTGEDENTEDNTPQANT